MNSVAELPTVGVIARRANCSVHQIEYLIRSRAIKPIGRAGNAFVYSENAVELIRNELECIDNSRSDNSETA